MAIKLTNKKKIMILSIIFILAVLIRIININQLMHGDEYFPYQLSEEGNTWNIILANGAGHPPMYIWIGYVFSVFFGNETWVFRLASLVFSILCIWFVYLIAKKLFGTKAAIISSALMAFSSWYVVMSTQIHLDANFLLFFYLSSFYSFMLFTETGKKRYLYITGFLFGCALLTKLTGALIIPILMIYSYINFEKLDTKRRILAMAKSLPIIIIIGIFMFGILFFLKWLHPDVTAVSVSGLSSTYLSFFQNLTDINAVLLLSQLALAIFLLGPLYILLILLSFRKIDKKYIVFYFWIMIILLFYTIVLKGNARSFERYLIPILPAICIIGGNTILNLIRDLKIKSKLVTYVSIALGLIIAFFLATWNVIYLQFYPKSAFYDHVISLQWNFAVPFNGNAGPIGFYVSFLMIASFFIFSFLIYFVYLAVKKKSLARTILLVMLGIAIAYNLFIIQEFSFNSTSPDIDKISKEVIYYVNENGITGNFTIFRNFSLIAYIKNSDKLNALNFEDENNENMTQIISNTTVILIDFPLVNKESELWKAVNNCDILKSFEDKNQTIGYVYSCH